MHILYKLVFASGKAYIGQTARNMSIRIAQHKRSVKSGSQLMCTAHGANMANLKSR
jgi:predicted GIY-YIG superfamily endonuclease